MAASCAKQRSLLKQYIDSFQSCSDILSDLDMTFEGSSEEIKAICRRKIDGLDDGNVRRVFYNLMPIDSIIPIDIIQKILSFDQSIETDFVCKVFKKCNDKNRAMRERERLIAVSEYEFEPNITYNASMNRRYIVRKDGALNEKEIEKGFILKENFKDAIQGCNSGDEVYVDGPYFKKQSCWIITKNITIYIKLL